MTTVEHHISNLLYINDCVIIPDFGAFVASPVSAHVDTDKNILTPPTKEIGFNRSLSHNDGLLISTFANIRKLSYGKAKVEVEIFRNRLVEAIENGKEFHIEKVGSLKLDSIGNVQFSPVKSENYLTDSFGLSSFHFTPDVQIKPVKENIQVKRLLRPLSQKHIAASVALVVGLFAISPVVNDEGQNEKFAASTIDFSSVNQNASSSDYIVNEQELNTTASEEISVVENIVEEEHFFLIAGSFKKETQAKLFLKQIHALGEDQAFVLESPNKRYRIALDGYTNKPEAINSLNAYRKLNDFKTVWVLKQ